MRLLFLFTVSYLLFAVPVFAQEINCERQECERMLAELESQMANYQSAIDVYKQQGKTLQTEVNSLNAKISKINLQIKAVNLSLAKLDGEITENKKEIQITENKLSLNTDALVRLLRNLYENERSGLVEVLLKNPRLSDFFNNINNLLSAQDGMALTLAKVKDLRNSLLDEKESLASKRSEVAALKSSQDAQRANVQKTRIEKNDLLTQTKGQESKYQEILKQTRKTAAQIRSRIFEFLGGGEMTFEEAYQFAKFAEQATGVRSALILSVLEKESLLGQNVGRCIYKTAMHPTRDVPIFLALTSSLGINPDTVTVSCANRDGAYGGAMGPAQFIPSTWNLYSAKVAEITGSSPPSPWRNGDAFVATALYLKDSIKGCDAIYSKQTDVERCAAAKYYAGGRWKRHLWGYGDRVVTRAQQFQADIDTLNS